MMGGFSAEAVLEVAEGKPAQGTICALGDLNGGWSFYLLDGRPVSVLVAGTGQVTRVAGPEALGPGRHTVTFSYQPAAGSPNCTLAVDGHQVDSADHPGLVLFLALSTAGARLLVGRDGGLPFTEDYEPPFPLTATLAGVTVRSAHAHAERAVQEIVTTATAAD
jgi:arylsulfatase